MTTAKKKDAPPAEPVPPVEVPEKSPAPEPTMLLCVPPEGGCPEVFFGSYKDISDRAALLRGVLIDVSAFVTADFRDREQGG